MSSEPAAARDPSAPVNEATPLRALGASGSTAGHFRRDHLPAPEPDELQAVTVGGLVARPQAITPDAVRRLPARTLAVVLECAGHRRAELRPRTPGLQWGVGAVGEATWTGAALADVLSLAGIAPGAVEVVLEGGDRGPFDGAAGAHAFARSLPLAKAVHPDTIVAYAMDGGPIPHGHGGPLRMIVPGWYATDSVKWLTRVEVVADPFAGVYQALDYRYAEADDGSPGERMTELPVHAVVTEPGPGTRIVAGPTMIRGAAWGGRGGVATVHVRVDDGPWTAAAIERPAGPYARSPWRLAWTATPGRHVIAVRAGDERGARQPDTPRWNRGGYANSSVHTVAVAVERPALR